jgi:fructose-bisphosphate aldolase class II
MLAEASDKGYGVLSLLGGNLDMVLGQVGAAEAQRAPLILAFNQGVTPRVPMDIGMHVCVRVAQRATVPVATILDHGRTIEDIEQAIALGSSAVMIDGSALDYEENVRLTTEVVRMARSVGVDVEAELGSIAGCAEWRPPDVDGGAAEDLPKSVATDPAMAADFVRRTRVDALAISFGNVHGTYLGEPSLDLNLVREVRSRVDVPLVMHGGSGLELGQYAAIVEAGISKVGYYTAAGIRAVNHLKDELGKVEWDSTVYHDVIATSIDFFRRDTIRLMEVMGCAGVV